MHDLVTAVVAAVAMFVADVLSVLLTQAEARNRAVLAGILDSLAWGAGIVVTLTTLDALNGTNRPLMYAVIGAVSAANFGGSLIGVRVGKRFVKEDPATELAARVAAIEAGLSK